MLSLGAVIALSTFSTVSLTMDDIDAYKVEKWYDWYSVKLLSSNNQELGSITLFISKEDKATHVGVNIDYDNYAVSITENAAGTRGSAEFKQNGKTIGQLDIIKDHNDEIKLRNASPNLKQFKSSFHLIRKITKDPNLIRKLGSPIHIDRITNGEAFWCGVGTAGATIIATPIGGFFYAVSCGLFADMDSWSFGFGGGGGGGGGTAGAGHCHGHACYQVVQIWR